MSNIYTDPPQSRNEAIIKSTIDGTQYTDPPQSRMEDLLLDLKEAIEGGGGGGTTVVANPEGEATDELEKLQVGSDIYEIPKDYAEMSNKPSINSVELIGDKTASELGLQAELDGAQTVSGNPITVTDAEPMNTESVVVELEPKQDLHGYDAPWVGGAGKNKCPFDNFSFTSANTWCSLVGEPAANLLDGSPVTLKSGTYYANLIDFINIDNMQIADSSGNLILNSIGGSFTLPSDDTIYIRVRQINTSTTTSSKLQIEQGSVATSFTPYSNICPITGYSEVNVERVGKNLLNINASGIVQDAMFNPQTLEIVGSENYDISDYIEVKEGVTYKYSRVADSLSVPCGVFYDKDKNPISFKGNIFTMTIPSGIKYVRLELLKVATNQQLEVGSSKTTYEPYQGNTYTIDLDGTKYGGTLDVTNGDVDSRFGFIELDGSEDENWQKESSDWNVNHLNVFYIQLPVAGKNVGDSATPNIISNSIEVISFNGIQSADKHGYMTQSGYGQYIDVALDFDTVADLKTWLANNPLQVCYELATPLTIQLTPTQIQMLENTNNISTDGTNITLKYQPNNVIGECKAYTDEKCSEVLPPLPTTDGTYHLSCEVTSGAGVLSWVSDS